MRARATLSNQATSDGNKTKKKCIFSFCSDKAEEKEKVLGSFFAYSSAPASSSSSGHGAIYSSVYTPFSLSYRIARRYDEAFLLLCITRAVLFLCLSAGLIASLWSCRPIVDWRHAMSTTSWMQFRTDRRCCVNLRPLYIAVCKRTTAF